MEKRKSEGYALVAYGNAANAFQLQSFEIKSPVENEVLIEVEAFGLNYADVMARNKMYREAPPLPAILGYEVVGIVQQVGKNADSSLLGKRVVAFTRFGGYAKHVITFDSAVAVIENMPAEEALSLSTQFVTAYYMACYLAPVYPNDKVLIHAAAGGVGTALIQLCKWRGAFVIAKIGHADKTKLVTEMGADVVINYSESDYKQQLQTLLKDERLDVSFNPVAGSTFKKDFSMLGSGGKLILFGGSEMSGSKWGLLSTLNFVRKMGLVLPIGLMMRSKNILGVNMLKIADNKRAVLTTCLKEVVALTHQGILKPQVGATFKADQIADAHALLESGKSTGKIALFW